MFIDPSVNRVFHRKLILISRCPSELWAGGETFERDNTSQADVEARLKNNAAIKINENEKRALVSISHFNIYT
jgi:hypothetical protein